MTTTADPLVEEATRPYPISEDHFKYLHRMCLGSTEDTKHALCGEGMLGIPPPDEPVPKCPECLERNNKPTMWCETCIGVINHG